MRYAKNIIVCLVPALLVLAGCGPVLKCIYGIKKPRPETPASITAYAEKRGYPTQNIAVFSDSSTYLEMIRNPVFRNEIFGTMIFDSALNLLLKDSTLCQWSGCPRLARISPDSAYRIIPEFDSRRLFSGLTLINDTLQPGLIAPARTILSW